MTISINVASAIKQPRTGVEEYTYQLLKHLTMLPEAREHRFLLYIPDTDTPSTKARFGTGQARIGTNNTNVFGFELPENFIVKELKWPMPMWTQIRLASEVVFNKPDALFIPVHVLPLAHPKNSVVTIHGLEYEYFPEMYPWWHRQYLRWSTRYAVRHARKIIAVSESTKRDLMKFYGADGSKICVVHHGYRLSEAPRSGTKSKANMYNPSTRPDAISGLAQGINFPYLLYIGRIELKKNILGILEAYKILKEKYKIPHQLVLVGHPGFGYETIKLKIKNLLEINNWKLEIREVGYVAEDEKCCLFSNASLFLFPSYYEGFGMPILEAQAVGVPVITSNISSMSEVAGDSALLVSPKNPEQIAKAVYKLVDDKAARDKLIELGYENVKRFSWEKCAKETIRILLED